MDFKFFGPLTARSVDRGVAVDDADAAALEFRGLEVAEAVDADPQVVERRASDERLDLVGPLAQRGADVVGAGTHEADRAGDVHGVDCVEVAVVGVVAGGPVEQFGGAVGGHEQVAALVVEGVHLHVPGVGGVADADRVIDEQGRDIELLHHLE